MASNFDDIDDGFASVASTLPWFSHESYHTHNLFPHPPLPSLGMVHSRQLFHRRLFKSDENCPSYLQEISKQILKKCDGLPLAIIAISGLLANTEKTKVLWNQVKDSIGHALERNPSVE